MVSVSSNSRQQTEQAYFQKCQTICTSPGSINALNKLREDRFAVGKQCQCVQTFCLKHQSNVNSRHSRTRSLRIWGACFLKFITLAHFNMTFFCDMNGLYSYTISFSMVHVTTKGALPGTSSAHFKGSRSGRILMPRFIGIWSVSYPTILLHTKYFSLMIPSMPFQ